MRYDTSPCGKAGGSEAPMKRDRTIYRIPTKDEEAQSLWRRVVPVEVDQGFISRAIIAELDRRCTGDVPPGRHEWARRDFENVLTDDEGLPRMLIFEISDAVLAALGIGGSDEAG